MQLAQMFLLTGLLVHSVQSLITPRSVPRSTSAKVCGLPRHQTSLFALYPGQEELPGDYGFDPLNLSQDEKNLQRMREAEIKHCRLAMLGVVGWPISESYHKSIASFFGLPSILASNDRVPSVLNGGLSFQWMLLFFSVTALIGLFIEAKSLGPKVYEGKGTYVIGDLGFDPFGFANLREGVSMQTAEINNGRTAMLAITIYVIREFLTGQPIITLYPWWGA